MNFKEKSKVELKTFCSTCGKPIADKAQSNVTRYLSMESRCMCADPQADNRLNTSPATIETAQSNSQTDEETAIEVSKSDVIANLGERYEVQTLLGQGGMGAVYKVRDKELQKTFAIKVLNSNLVEDKNSLKRFEQEAQAARGLTSPNLVAVYDYGMGKKGSPYIVMDYLDGTSLDTVLAREGYLDVPRALDIFIQVCEAMVHAHSKSVVHRDIKPSNIMLTKGIGGGDFVKLVDFGIAKVLPSQQKATQNLTQTGDIFGSPLYMSPEQCLGNKLDNRSDIYAIGCVMYETLTGQQPFAAENPIKIILKHLNEDAKLISDLPHDYKIPKPLQAVLLWCLEKDPDNRYQSADELLLDLQAIRDGKPLKMRKLKRKQPTGLAIGKPAIIAFAVAILLVFSVQLFNTQLTQLRNSGQTPISIGAPNDPVRDANDFDNKSYQYFINKDYEKAIPLLQFGLSAYKDRGPYYLADNYQHIGKCYKELGKYPNAVDYYEKALMIYGEQKKIHGPGYGMEGEARTDYADVLRHLGNPVKAGQVASGAYTPTEAVEPAPNIQ
ncbi:MAG: serine/threonine protein kinase [Cyanobacteria bacterium SZAS-4]|nr:serine/threonine protein kinase [Cyanobacteria bacterium SZAS-4]